MRPVKILLRLRRGRARTVKAFANVRVRSRRDQSSYPRQLHLGYFKAEDNFDDFLKNHLFGSLLAKWPRSQKPEAIDWKDAEAKLVKLRHVLRERGIAPSERDPLDHVALSSVSNITSSQEGMFKDFRPALSAPDHIITDDLPQTRPEAPLSQPSKAPSFPTSQESTPKDSGRLSASDRVVTDAPPQTESEASISLSLRSETPFSQEELLRAIPHLTNVALRLTMSHDEANDLVQATVERALRSARHFVPGTTLMFWMTRIMRNLHVDRLRMARAAREISVSTDLLDLMPAGIQAEIQTEEPWKMFDLVDIVEVQDLLDPGLREIFQLAVFDELSYSQIAYRLGISINSVGSRLFRARRKIRQLMEDRARIRK